MLPAYADIAEQLDVRGAPVYEQIAEKYGETVEKISLEICAGLLTGSRADALEVPDGTPSLVHTAAIAAMVDACSRYR